MDETKMIDEDQTRLSESAEKTFSNQTTIRSSEPGQVILPEQEQNPLNERTALLFGKTDIEKKLLAELEDIPEIEQEDLEPENFSKLISRPFSTRTEEERTKINRHFLRDAEPFSLERLIEDIRTIPDGLLTGFPSLDEYIKIPLRKMTFIASRPKHGKTAFMLNLLLNLSSRFPDMHYLYYSYGEARPNIELKLINISGDTPFSQSPGLPISNFSRWKYELQKHDIHTLQTKAEQVPEFIGLKKFLAIAPCVHVIDFNYNIADLLDSIRSFTNTLPIGAIFIDYFQAIFPEKSQRSIPRNHQMFEMATQLIDFQHTLKIPIIVGTQITPSDTNIPEYDQLSLDNLKELGDIEQISDLLIGIQNYSNSQYIGSNSRDDFKSLFYDLPFKKAETMPETFKDKHPNTVMLCKVLVNKNGIKPEVELLFNKWLMRVIDLKEHHSQNPIRIANR